MQQKFSKDFSKNIISQKATLRQAMHVITKTEMGIALIVSSDQTLLGIVVDTDIRRALLCGVSMDVCVEQIMNTHPLVADASLSAQEIRELFQKNQRAYIPLIDSKGKVVGLVNMIDYLAVPNPFPVWTVVMAGGMGRRLRPLTNNCPKPMVRLGNKPILELVIERLTALNLNRFIISVNYLENQIRDYFGDGSHWGAQIEYISEPLEMGTVGSLSLIQRDLGDFFIVINGDLLTTVNFRSLIEFHQNEDNLATVCVRQYDFQVPYGVINIHNHKFAGITEKPTHRFFVNAGIYVFDTKVLAWLEKNTPCDMPEFLREINRRNPENIGCFPIQEYWLDIGRPEDYQRAVKEYNGVLESF